MPKGYSIIICGYSGRDECIMQSLRESYKNQKTIEFIGVGMEIQKMK